MDTALEFSTCLPIGVEVWAETAFSHDDHRQLAQFGNIIANLRSPQLVVEIINRLLLDQQRALAEEAQAAGDRRPLPAVFKYNSDSKRVIFIVHARFALKMFSRILVNPFKDDPPFFNQYGRLVVSQKDYQGFR